MKRLLIFLIRVIFGILFRVRVLNIENIPKNGAALLCANHINFLDMFLIGYKIDRYVHWIAKEELFRNPLSAAFFRALEAFPVKRGKGDINSVKTALKLLEKGHIVGVFPESTRMKGRTDGISKVRRGAATLALMANVPVLPVGIKGEYRLFGRIVVVFGKPYTFEIDRTIKHTNEELSKMTRDIMIKIYAMLEEE